MSDSSIGSVVLTREQLYEQVWQKPILRLAREYGISNVGLAKVCKKHNIPRPGRGYWAKLAHGKEVEKTPLPSLDDEGLQEIELFRQAFFDEPQNDVVKKELAVTAVVLDTLTDPDPLIEFARRHLEKRKPGKDSLLRTKDARCLDVCVSPNQLDRALRIYDAFVKAWKSLGGEMRVAESKTDEVPTLAAFGDTSVRIMLYEETKRKQTNARNRYLPRHMCECIPTGKLVFEIDSYGDGLRRRWADGKTQRLEKLVESFTRGVHEFIEYRRVQRLDHECEQRQRVRLEEVRKAREQREAFEKKRREEFERFVEDWQKARQMREYLTELEDILAKEDVAPKNPDGLAKWLEWAHWYVKCVDPLSETPPNPEVQPSTSNVKVEDLDISSHTREALERLGIEETDAMCSLTQEQIRNTNVAGYWRIWDELCRVMECQGYRVAEQ